MTLIFREFFVDADMAQMRRCVKICCAAVLVKNIDVES